MDALGDSHGSGQVCLFCETTFMIHGSEAHKLIVEDDGEWMTIAFYCPECSVSRAEDIANAHASREAWLKGLDNAEGPS